MESLEMENNVGRTASFIQTSPLDNYLVLKQIFECLPYKDIKNCRQVSRFWDQEASPILSRLSVLKYHDNSFVIAENFYSKVYSSYLIIASKYFGSHNLTQLLKESGMKVRFLQVWIRLKTSFYQFIQSGTDMQNFVTSCKNLKELTVFLDDYDHAEFELPVPLQFFESLTPNGCPWLRTLEFSFITSTTQYERHLGPGFYTKVFDFAPNVVELSFDIEKDERIYNRREMAKDDIILAMESRPYFIKKVRSLRFGYKSRSEHVRSRYPGHSPSLTVKGIKALSQMKFDCLEELDIEHVPSLQNTFNLQDSLQLLNNFSKTLKYLRLGSYNFIGNKFRLMPKLEEFVFSGNVDAKFFDSCPNLVRCSVSQSAGLDEDFFLWTLMRVRQAGESQIINRSLKKVVIRSPIVFSLKDIYSLECFPSLKMLKIKLKSEPELLFSIVWSDTAIEELELILTTGENFDAALSGLTVAECQRLEASRTFQSEQITNFRHKTFADWKCLQKLSIIKSKNPEQKHKLSGVASCQGLARIRNITCLELEIFEIQETNLQFMLENMNLTTLKLRDCDVLPAVNSGETTNNLKTLSVKFPRLHIEV